jgi:hypothetical protein
VVKPVIGGECAIRAGDMRKSTPCIRSSSFKYLFSDLK